MKKVIFLLAAAITLSCQNTKTEKIDPVTGEVILVSDDESQDSETSKKEENTELIAHPMSDNKGKVMFQLTLPANWMLHTKPGRAAISGPNGIFVYNFPLRNFMHSQNQMMAQAYAQHGGKLRAPLSAEQIVRQDLVPVATREGSKLIKITPTQSIAKADAAMQDMMYQIGRHDVRYDSVLAEFEDKKGDPYAIVIVTSHNYIGDMMMWTYYGYGLEAPKAQYEQAKTTLVNGLASKVYNPRYFDQHNQSEINRESASWAAHNQKMANNQRNFDAQQAAYRDRTESINKSIMASYEARNASSDRQHNRFLNYVKGEETVTNSDGKRYQVESGSDHYWMNNDGQYIGTNDPNYDPNRNQGTVNETWNEVPMDN